MGLSMVSEYTHIKTFILKLFGEVGRWIIVNVDPLIQEKLLQYIVCALCMLAAPHLTFMFVPYSCLCSEEFWFETVYLYSVNTLHRIAQIICIRILWSVWLQCMLGRYVIVTDCMQLVIAPQWVTKPLFSDLGLVLHGHSSAIAYPCCSGLLYLFMFIQSWAW